MLRFSHEKLKELMKIPENKKCFDCNNPSCQWASVNNGIFLCTNCSGIHRGLGVEISYIRSILWDNWTEYQIEFMIQGGNKQLKELLKTYSFDNQSMTCEKFYKTKIMEYYRKYLKNKVERTNCIELLPSKEEAFEESSQNISINKENKFTSFGSISDDNTNEKNDTSFQDNIKNWIGWAYQGTKDTINNLEISNKISYVGNTIKETGNKIMENEKVQNFNENVSYYFNWLIGNKNNNNENSYAKEQSINKNISNDIKNKDNSENILNDDIKENNKNDINIKSFSEK